MHLSKNPCNACPYQKSSCKGWLGDASYDPELFLQQLELPELHPCHLAVNWNHVSPGDLSLATKCIGALQFMNNSLKISRNSAIAVMQKQTGKNENVFSTRRDFINHHSNTIMQPTIPPDQDLKIDRYHFVNGPIEVGTWKDDNTIQKAFRKYGGQWHIAKDNETANVVVKLVFMNDTMNQTRMLTKDEAWSRIKYMLNDLD